MALRPISAVEFVKMMQRAKPPVDWSDTIAVANSGGPDSTCLLFLLNRYLKEQRAQDTINKLPRRLVSLTIDHDLQPSSRSMANHAARIAGQLGVQHITTKLPWGEGTHPPKPGPDDKIEERARDMRYTILLENLISLKANALALGHHLDDQVETMLMRLGRGSSSLGLAGMKPCRRWLMDDHEEGHLVVNQLEKLRKWIIRPLLSVDKDRILATCEAHSLEYVTDETNFQPQLTIRNAVRHVIKEGQSAGSTQQDFSAYPTNIVEQLGEINVAAAKLYGDSFNLGSGIGRLREVSSQMTANLEDIDASVDNLIAKYRIPSPSGTFMISPLSLNRSTPQDIREAFSYRVVRYVSPYPWGSPKSQLGRRKASVQRLVNHLWDFQYQTQKNNSLCVGSGVLWKLVAIANRRLRTDVRNQDIRKLAWIAFRQPPQRPGQSAKEQSLKELNPLLLDVTNDLLQCGINSLIRNARPQHQIIFDGRFLIQFEVNKMPQSILESLSDGGKVLIEPHQFWSSPQVTHVYGGEAVILHTHLDESLPSMKFHIGSNVRSDWITSYHIRSLSAI